MYRSRPSHFRQVDLEYVVRRHLHSVRPLDLLFGLSMAAVAFVVLVLVGSMMLIVASIAGVL